MPSVRPGSSSTFSEGPGSTRPFPDPLAAPARDPLRPVPPYDVDPLQVVGGSRAAAEAHVADRCVGLPPVSGVSTCLDLVVVPSTAGPDCIVTSVDPGPEVGKLQRGSTVTIYVDCSDAATNGSEGDVVGESGTSGSTVPNPGADPAGPGTIGSTVGGPEAPGEAGDPTDRPVSDDGAGRGSEETSNGDSDSAGSRTDTSRSSSVGNLDGSGNVD